MEQNNIEKRVSDFQSDLADIQKKHDIQLNTTIIFPQYKILPDEVKLAILIIQKHGVQTQIVMEDASSGKGQDANTQ